MKAQPTPKEGEVWEVIAHGVRVVQAKAIDDDYLAPGDKFLIDEVQNDSPNPNWCRVLIWGRSGFIHISQIITGCKLLE